MKKINKYLSIALVASLYSTSSFALKTNEDIVKFKQEINSPNAESFLYSLSNEELADYFKSAVVLGEQEEKGFSFNQESSIFQYNYVKIDDIQVKIGETESINVSNFSIKTDDLREIILKKPNIETLLLDVKDIKITLSEDKKKALRIPSDIYGNINIGFNKTDDGVLTQNLNIDLSNLFRITFKNKTNDVNVIWNNIIEEKKHKDESLKKLVNEEISFEEYNSPEYQFKHPFIKSLEKNDVDGIFSSYYDFIGNMVIENYSFEFVNNGIIEKVKAFFPIVTNFENDFKGNIDNSSLNEEYKNKIIAFFNNPKSIQIKSNFEKPILIKDVFEEIKRYNDLAKEEMGEDRKKTLSDELVAYLINTFDTIFEVNTLEK